MNLDALEGRLRSLLPTQGLAERIIWLCAQERLSRARSQQGRADQAHELSTKALLEGWAALDVEAVSAYCHTIEVYRRNQ